MFSPVFFGLALIAALCTSHVSAAAIDGAAIVAQLRAPRWRLSPGTEILLRTDPSFANRTRRYTSHDAPTYLAAVKPALVSDVQKIVRFASAVSIPFLATGGGHGFATTLGRLHNGLEIDLSAFKQISIDKAAGTMTVGGSVLIGDVIEPLYNAGKEIQTGSQRCVGLVGATLGGGIGRYSGLHGMIVDALKSVQLVTAGGDLITASADEHSDLFWGIRGAGFNFGIVVSATYTVFDRTNHGQVVNADFLFTANQSTAVFEYFKSLETTLPAELALILQTGFNPQYGGTYIVVNAIYAGPLEGATPLLKPLGDIHPVQQNISTIPWRDVTTKAFFGTAAADCTKGTNRNVYGSAIKTYDIPTFQTFFAGLQKLWADHPDTRQSVFFIEAFPTQAARAVPDEETAYPWRDTSVHLLFNFGYPAINATLEQTITAFAQTARAAFAATGGFAEPRIYVSYAHGDERPETLYGARKLPRLRALKRQWDPEGRFGFNVPF
ncbi:MAG: hypothetical protein LQ349_005408 [Xanthoria aureola]|nr:MAG: hypothetical protein LQ349_005408 [Xanthoria aureola]